MKYRKKPIIIEAYKTDVELDIETLEGVMHASKGDYIITGVNGEKYPCKPDIFEKTYELVEESNYEMSEDLSPLEALEEIISTFYDKDSEEIRIVKTALKEYELMKEIKYTARFDLAQVNKEHKALEIMKNKEVDIALLKWCFEKCDCLFYNQNQVRDNRYLKDEEYDLLKEVLL